MTPKQMELAADLLARLRRLDDISACPDVQEIREVAREILAEQLREIDDVGTEPPPLPTKRRHPRAG